jgi:hypothetical protein
LLAGILRPGTGLLFRDLLWRLYLKGDKMQYPFVACSKCHSEVSTDREACPHCGEPLPEPSDVVKLRADNARLKSAVEAEMAKLREENASLSARLTNPKAAN